MTVTSWPWNVTAEAFWARMEHDPPLLDNLWRELRPPDTHAYEPRKRPEPKPQPHPRPRPKPTRKQVDPFPQRQMQVGINILNRHNQEKNR